MMNVMMTYNPVLVLLFTASWTAGMAAMMFPAIVSMVLLYNRLITNKLSQSSTLITDRIALLSGWSFPINSVVKLLEKGKHGG